MILPSLAGELFLSPVSYANRTPVVSVLARLTPVASARIERAHRDMKVNVRRDITLESDGLQLAGWLYLPEQSSRQPAPAIVMANALSAVKEIYLSNYAERFAAKGFAVLVFDYRNFGASEGEPRCQLYPHEQVEDLRNAITWLRKQPEIDPDRIGAWGVSLGGGHVIGLAPFDRRIKAVVSVVPATNNWRNSLVTMPRGLFASILAMLAQDREERYEDGHVNYAPLVAPPGQPSSMPEEAYHFYTHAQETVAPRWENRLSVPSMEKVISYDPGATIELLAPTPLLMIAADDDQILPPSIAKATFDRAGEPKRWLSLPCGHTGIYDTEPFLSQTAEASIDWFRTHLPDPELVAEEAERSFIAASSRPEEISAKTLMCRILAATNTSELEKLDDIVADDYLEHDPVPDQEPGREGLKKAYRMFNAPFPDLKYVSQDMLAEGDLVVSRGIISGTHSDEFFGVPATGRRVFWTGTRIFRVKDDRIVEGWINIDLLSLMQQMGVVPGPPGAGLPIERLPTPQGEPATREESKAIMRRLIDEFWNGRDLDAADELFHPDAISPSAPFLPAGPEGPKTIARMFFSAFPDYQIQIEHLIGEDDRVAARLSQRGTHQGELMGVAATGREAAWTETGILRIADGRIVESWYDVDLLGMMQQLGVGEDSSAADQSAATEGAGVAR